MIIFKDINVENIRNMTINDNLSILLLRTTCDNSEEIPINIQVLINSKLLYKQYLGVSDIVSEINIMNNSINVEDVTESYVYECTASSIHSDEATIVVELGKLKETTKNCNIFILYYREEGYDEIYPISIREMFLPSDVWSVRLSYAIAK